MSCIFKDQGRLRTSWLPPRQASP